MTGETTSERDKQAAAYVASGGGNLPELLVRAILFMRSGQCAYGCLSWNAFLNHRDKKNENYIDKVHAAMGKSDYIQAADVIEYFIAPQYF